MNALDTRAPLHVVITVEFPTSFIEQVRSVSNRIVVHHHPVADQDDEVPASVLAEAEVMYTREVLPGADEAPALRWVQLDTSGIDHVRSSGLWDSPATITTLGGVSPGPIAEWVLMMILAHAHHFRATEALAARREWPSRSERWTKLMPHDLRRCTVGVVGYGRIGREIGRLCQTFGMRVLAVCRDPSSDRPGMPVRQRNADIVVPVGTGAFESVLAACEYVVVTVPRTPETEGLIGEREFAAMKHGAVLINASRGGVVDEPALLAALDRGQVDLVASDVFAEEPLPPDNLLWSHPRSVVTPHVAGFAGDYLDAVTRLFIENLRRYLNGKPLLNVADRALGY